MKEERPEGQIFELSDTWENPKCEYSPLLPSFQSIKQGIITRIYIYSYIQNAKFGNANPEFSDSKYRFTCANMLFCQPSYFDLQIQIYKSFVFVNVKVCNSRLSPPEFFMNRLAVDKRQKNKFHAILRAYKKALKCFIQTH